MQQHGSHHRHTVEWRKPDTKVHTLCNSSTSSSNVSKTNVWWQSSEEWLLVATEREEAWGSWRCSLPRSGWQLHVEIHCSVHFTEFIPQKQKVKKDKVIYPNFMSDNRVTVPFLQAFIVISHLINVPGDLPLPRKGIYLRALSWQTLRAILISGRDGRGQVEKHCF